MSTATCTTAGSANKTLGFHRKWSWLAAVTFLGLAATSASALGVYAQNRDPGQSGLPMLSAALFEAPYAREAFVLALLGVVFLTQRCDDTASSIAAWIFVLAFHNSSNDGAHAVYAAAAGLLTLILSLVSPNVPRVLKLLAVVSTLAFAVVFWRVDDSSSPYYATEYVCVVVLIAAAFYRVRGVCARLDTTAPLLCAGGC
jgi:hypothetical protein